MAAKKYEQIWETLRSGIEIDPYVEFRQYRVSELAAAINELLHDPHELSLLEDESTYKQNVIEAAQFVYTKYLSERTEKTQTPTRQPSLLTSETLQTLYSFAI